MENKPTVTSKNAEACQEIIKATTLEQHSIRQNGFNRYEARAIPNKRIEIAFGVSNAFTATTAEESQKFRKAAAARVQFDAGEWRPVVSTIQKVVEKQLQTLDSELSLVEVTQVVALKSAMSVLFNDFDVDDVSKDNAIKDLAKEINKQWMRSKDPYNTSETQPWAFEKQEKLVEALSTIFPDWNTDDRENNPLNFILPGYETVWRVILRCFTELTARGHADAEKWNEVLAAFVNTPTKDRLYDVDVDGSGVCAAWIARETLRLYAPTRRIYRQYKDANDNTFQAAADVEAAHRDKTTWGDDALLFRPARWAHVKDDFGVANFMAFGTKPLMCPAGQWQFGPSSDRLPFGLTFIAVVVGTMTTKTKDQWKIEGALPDDGSPLSTDRDAYEELRLVRVG